MEYKADYVRVKCNNICKYYSAWHILSTQLMILFVVLRED